jgi:oxalate decarboxylase/phosphoglucose isomerase-like protein (cupin superfamily)
VYWIYDVPGGEVRGGHAYRELKEVIIALSGSFDVILHDGKDEKHFTLNRSYTGLYVPNMMWRRLENFSTNAMALVVANAEYDAADYIRDFERFKQLKGGA